MRRIILLLLAGLTLIAAGCGGDDEGDNGVGGTQAAAAPALPEVGDDQTRKPDITVPEGPAPTELQTIDIVEGDGAEVGEGDTVSVDYVGVLWDGGEQFDASWDSGAPIQFPLGTGQVIPGWDQGIEGMRVGGRRMLIIPPDLAYGETGAPPDIPPNATLVFVVDLKRVSG